MVSVEFIANMLLAKIFVEKKLVEVLLVIVPTGTFIEEKDKLLTDRLVIVAEVRVAISAERLVIIDVDASDVEARVVEANKAVN